MLLEVLSGGCHGKSYLEKFFDALQTSQLKKCEMLRKLIEILQVGRGFLDFPKDSLRLLSDSLI